MLKKSLHRLALVNRLILEHDRDTIRDRLFGKNDRVRIRALAADHAALDVKEPGLVQRHFDELALPERNGREDVGALVTDLVQDDARAGELGLGAEALEDADVRASALDVHPVFPGLLFERPGALESANISTDSIPGYIPHGH